MPINTDELRGRLEDPRPLLNGIGALMVAQAQAAFREQRLDNVEWPERYPSQNDPFINISGALEDLKEAPRIRERRFDRRPALIDTGRLEGSLDFRIVGEDEVEAGSTVEYAVKHQHGLDSVQTITETARENLRRVIRRGGRGGVHRARMRKLLFILRDDELQTQTAWRPFLGMTDQLEDDIRRLTEEYFTEGRVG